MNLTKLPEFKGVAEDLSEFLFPEDSWDDGIYVKEGRIKVSKGIGYIRMYACQSGQTRGFVTFLRKDGEWLLYEVFNVPSEAKEIIGEDIKIPSVVE